MGQSKTYKGGPSWAEPNTPGNIENAKMSHSKGHPIVTAEGTYTSGADDYGRKGLKAKASTRTKSGKITVKASGLHGQS